MRYVTPTAALDGGPFQEIGMLYTMTRLLMNEAHSNDDGIDELVHT